MKDLNPVVAQALGTLRSRLHQHARLLQDHQMIYTTLLGSYKQTNLQYRAAIDPSQPLPDASTFEKISQELKQLDPLGMTTPPKKPEGFVEQVDNMDFDVVSALHLW